MKVIQKGRGQKGWAKEFTCTGKGNGDGGCEAVLLVEADDIFRTKRQPPTTEVVGLSTTTGPDRDREITR